MTANEMERELRKAKYAGIEFRLADIESAHAFLDVADSNLNPESVQRNVGNARRALAAVKHFLAKLEVDAEFLSEFGAARDKLQARLDGFTRR